MIKSKEIEAKVGSPNCDGPMRVGCGIHSVATRSVNAANSDAYVDSTWLPFVRPQG
jgi:hypothetical protein